MGPLGPGARPDEWGDYPANNLPYIILSNAALIMASERVEEFIFRVNCLT